MLTNILACFALGLAVDAQLLGCRIPDSANTQFTNRFGYRLRAGEIVYAGNSVYLACLKQTKKIASSHFCYGSNKWMPPLKQCQTKVCYYGQVSCGTSGICIPASSRCNGKNDCGDFSDEIGCPILVPPIIVERVVERKTSISFQPQAGSCGVAIPGTHPWLVKFTSHFHLGLSSSCEGVLLADQWVLTSAHCVDKKNGENLKYVELVFGSQKATHALTSISPAVYIHPQYSSRSGTYIYDLALIRITRKVSFNQWITPICLPESLCSSTGIDGCSSVTLAGWAPGHRRYQGRSDVVKQTIANVVSRDSCVGYYHHGITLEQACMTNPYPSRCPGDSGTTAICQTAGKSHLVGLLSYGDCSAPAVYTRVCSSLNWIKEMLGIH